MSTKANFILCNTKPEINGGTFYWATQLHSEIAFCHGLSWSQRPKRFPSSFEFHQLSIYVHKRHLVRRKKCRFTKKVVAWKMWCDAVMLFEVFLLLLLLLPFSSIVKSNEVIGDYHLCHTNLCPHIFSTCLLRNVSIHLQRNSSATIACLTRRIEIFDVIFHLM